MKYFSSEGSDAQTVELIDVYRAFSVPFHMQCDGLLVPTSRASVAPLVKTPLIIGSNQMFPQFQRLL